MNEGLPLPSRYTGRKNKVEVFFDCKPRQKTRFLKKVTHPRFACQAAVYCQASAVGRNKTGKKIQERCFAAARRSKKNAYTAAAAVQGKIIEKRQAAETFPQAADFNICAASHGESPRRV
jgi:hypothetical protein